MSARKRTPPRPIAPEAVVPALSSEEIARRAHEVFLARGGEPGHDLDDWLEAERQLLAEIQRDQARGKGA